MDPKRLLLVGVAGGALFAGGIVAGATTLAPMVASAATASPAPGGAAPGAGAGSGAPGAGAMPAHGTPEHEGAETAVTGDNASKAQAAAVKAVGGGTAGAVTTDFTKTGYEVTVTKGDGSSVEVHLDSSFNVMRGPRG